MLNSTLIDIFKTYEKADLKRFEDFIKSPYFNKKTNVVSLFNIIKKYFPDYKTENLKRETVWKALYPGKDFNYGVMKNLIHDLTKLAENYLQTQILELDSFKKQIPLLENLNHRAGKKLFASKYKQLFDDVSSQNLFKWENYVNLKELSMLEYDFNFHNTSINKNEDLTYRISEYQIYSSLIECFKNYNNMVVFTLRNNFSKEINIAETFLKNLNVEFILDEIRKQSEHDFMIMKTYYLMYLATRNTDEPKYYFDYKSYLIQNDSYFEISEKRLLYKYLENTLALNDKIPGRNREYFEIDKLRIERKLILDKNNNITFSDFAGIVKTAAEFNEAVFLEKFVMTHLKNVPVPVRKNAEDFSMAYLFYLKGDLKKSLEIINSGDMNSHEFRINLRVLNLKILYEINDFVSTDYMIDSFRHYLTKNSIPEIMRIPYLNFCKCFTRLIKITEIKNYPESEIFRKEIVESNTANKAWLLEKVNVL